MLKFSGLLSLAVVCLASVESFGQAPVPVLCGMLGGNWTCAGSYPGGPVGASCAVGSCSVTSDNCNDWNVFQHNGDQTVNYTSAGFDENGSGPRELGVTPIICVWEIWCAWECVDVAGVKKCTNLGISLPYGGFDVADVGPCP
jgi:hypothetical protein